MTSIGEDVKQQGFPVPKALKIATTTLELVISFRSVNPKETLA